MFFAASALLLVTAGVFAGKAKFQTVNGVYYSPVSGSYTLIATPNGSDFALTPPAGGARAEHRAERADGGIDGDRRHRTVAGRLGA